MHKYDSTKSIQEQDYTNMREYEKINNEIKEFINMQEKKPEEELLETNKNSQQENGNQNILKLLEDLLELYKEIHSMIENKDFENVKNKILNSDIKNALVCESLMKILKDECTEKNEKIKELEQEKINQKKLIDDIQNLKMKIGKLESEMIFTNRSNNELNRLVKDQKNLLISAKEKAELERKNCESIKNVNKELEILRNKAYERCKIYEKEINVIKTKLNEKDEIYKKLQAQIKNLENEKNNLYTKNNYLERLTESLKKKLEAKEHSLNMCNEELAKLINKEKKNQSSLEDLKEKASYYERLYKATNKQNEYLNFQLAKMINLDNVDKLKNDSFNEKPNKSLSKKLKKYKKKYNLKKRLEEQKDNEMKNLKKLLDKLKTENMNLQEDKEQIVKGNKNVTNTLINKVDYLLERNKEYQNKLIENTSPDKGNESFKTLDDPDTSKNYIKPEFNQDYNLNINKEDLCTSSGLLKVKDHSNSTMFYDNTKYRRPFNLENEYEEETYKPQISRPQKIQFPGRIFNNNRLNNEGLGINQTQNGGDLANENWQSNIKLNTNYLNTRLKEQNDDLIFSAKPDKVLLSNGNKFIEDDARSQESGKSIKTTSSIKDMLRKTEDLQGRFGILEKQLDKIKEGNESENKKLHDQIKAYTDYYYSDYLDLSNDNDIL